MNWVGGARSRVKMRDELSKQKEYFEKKRYQNKVKRFEKPVSPRKRKLPLSTDLLSLQAATFSAKKFSTADSSSPTIQKKVTKVDLDQSRSLLPFHRRDDVELPMSPGAPSKLLLQEASSGVEQKQANIVKKTEETSSFLMTQKHLIRNDQHFRQFQDTTSPNRLSQMSSRLPEKEEIYPEKFDRFSNTTLQMSSRPPEKEEIYPEKFDRFSDTTSLRGHQFVTSPATQLEVPNVPQYYDYWPQKKQPKTPEVRDHFSSQSVHERAPENLFFEFLPQAMSTVKRPLTDEDVDVLEHKNPVTSPLSDISYADSLPSTIKDEEEEFLVPQINHSSPATTSSSPWEAGSLSTSFDISSDNTENREIYPRTTSRGHGPWSSTGEDTPQLSDSSLTTFRQYYRKKLNKSFKSSTDQPHATSTYSHVPRCQIDSMQQRKMDLLCHESPAAFSPIQHASKEHSSRFLQGDREKMDQPHIEHEDIQLIDSEEYSVSNKIDVDTGLKISMGDVLAGTKPHPDIQAADPEYQSKPAALSENEQGTKECNGVVRNDSIVTEWKAFLGGATEDEGTQEEDRTGVDSSGSEESSQRSSEDEDEDDRLNVTHQVLMEVMALDKKMNDSIRNTPGLPTIAGKLPDDCLEVYLEEVNPSQNLDSEDILRHQIGLNTFEECMKKVSHDNLNDIDKNKHIKELPTEINKPKDDMELSNNITSKEHIFPTVKTNASVHVESKSLDISINLNQPVYSDQSRKSVSDGIEKDTVVDANAPQTQSIQTCHSDVNKENDHLHITQSNGEKVSETEKDPSICKGNDAEIQCPSIFLSKKGNDVETQCSPIQPVDTAIQCQIIAAEDSKNKNTSADDKSLRLFKHAAIQTDEERVFTSDMPKKDVKESGVQCELYLQKMNSVSERQVPTIAGDRLNGREHKAYGPTQRADICLVS